MSKIGKRQEQLLKDVKSLMHQEYNHELAKFYNRRRYKEEKEFKRKRERKKLKRIIW